MNRLQHLAAGYNEVDAILCAIVLAQQATQAATQPGPNLDMAAVGALDGDTQRSAEHEVR